MQRAVELAGFFAAHGIWCVSDGGPLIPMLGQESLVDGRNLHRFNDETLEQSVARALAYLDSNPDNADCAAVIYDGYIALAPGRTDALLAVIRSYADPAATLTMAVPFREAESADGFAVYRPKFIDYQGTVEPNYESYGQAFFNGLESHEKGFAVWNRYFDASI